MFGPIGSHMQVEIRNLWGAAAPAATFPTGPAGASGAPADTSQLRAQARRAAERLSGAADDVLALARAAGGSAPGLPSVWSATHLGLRTEHAGASIRSGAEVNTTPTSYSTQTPSWQGSSPAPTVTGTYTGTSDTRWTFTVTATTFLGLGKNRIRVTDAAGAEVGELEFSNGHATTPMAVAHGLTVTFASRDFVLGDTFTLDVRASVGTSLRTDRAVSATGVDSARFDAGRTVVAGSFEVNGTTISVAAGDTVDQVLARISASTAGVTATYDAAADKVQLTARSSAQQQVVLSNDTSGLLRALKLDIGVVTAARTPDSDAALRQVARFAGVTAGSITVNGTAVAFDPLTDSLRTLAAKITAQTNLTASLDADDQLFVLSGRARGAAISLDDGGTGLLSALNITRHDVAASAARPGNISRSDLADKIGELRSELSALWTVSQTSGLEDVRSALLSALSSMTAHDRSLLRDLTGVSIKGGTLTFDDRTRADIVAALADAGRPGVGGLRQGSGSGADRGLAGALRSVARAVGRQAAG